MCLWKKTNVLWCFVILSILSGCSLDDGKLDFIEEQENIYIPSSEEAKEYKITQTLE